VSILTLFINVYTPANGPERVGFLSVLNSVLNGVDVEEFLFLGGDFNCTEDEKMRIRHKPPGASWTFTESHTAAGGGARSG